jgi:hypothetical protein
VPFLVRHYVPKIVQAELKRQAAIGEVRFNPYTFTFEANDFRLEEPGGEPIAGFKRLFIDFELKSLFNWAWTFREVSLDALQVNAVIAADGLLNLAQLRRPRTRPPARKRRGRRPGSSSSRSRSTRAGSISPTGGSPNPPPSPSRRST